jgi:O-antigen ligase
MNLLEKDLTYYKFIISLLISFGIPYATGSTFEWLNLLIGLLIIIWLFENDFKSKLLNLKLCWFICCTFGALYFINIFGLLYTQDMSRGWYEVSIKLPFIIFPILFLSSNAFTNKQIQIILYTFVFSVFLATLITFRIGIDFLFRGKDYTPIVEEILVTYSTDMGTYILFAHFILINSFFNKPFNLNKSFAKIILLTYFWLFLIFILEAKMAVFSLGFISVFMIFRHFFIKKKYQPLLISFVIMIIATIGVIGMSKSRTFLYKAYYNKFKLEEDTHLSNSFNSRYVIRVCVQKIISDDNNWIFGLGTGDDIDNLAECYKDKSEFMAKEKFGPHNEYFAVLLKFGMIGLSILAILLLVLLKTAFKTNDYVFIAFMFILILGCVTEVLLTRKTSIIYFTFFISLFLKNDAYHTK